MRREAVYALVLTLAAACGAWAQTGPMAPAEGGNAVAGLALPADFSVSAEEGFVEIQAECAGSVSWTVIGSVPVKFKPTGKSVIVATPARGGSVIILAVGLVGGNLTEFARVNVQVTPAGPVVPPAPPPSPLPTSVVAGKWFVTLVFDPSTQTPAQAAVLNSAELRRTIQANGQLRVVDRLDKWLADKKLDTFANQVGGYPVLLVQDEQGVVRSSQRLPDTEAAALAVIRSLRGQQP